MLLDFPNEILSYIIENLNLKDRYNLSLTCKKLNEISKDTYLNVLKLVKKNDHLNFIKHHKVRNLCIYRMIIPETMLNFKFIHKLSIINLYLTYIDLKKILKNCYNLKILKLSDCHGITKKCLEPLRKLNYFEKLDIYSGLIIDLPKNLNNIKILNVCNYFHKDINPNLLENILSYKNLKYLKISNLLKIDKKKFKKLKNLVFLEKLIINCCYGLNSYYFLLQFKNLKYLSIKKSFIRDMDLNELLKSNIIKFDFSDSPWIEGNIKTKNIKCKEINFFNCTNIKQKNLKTFKNIINLEIICLQRCKSLFDTYTDLKYNKHLKKVFVTSMDVVNYIELKQNLPKLKIIVK